MKAKLIKKSDGWYNLYDKEIGIGSTHAELQGHKLSKQNCDEIFGVVDVESLALSKASFFGGTYRTPEGFSDEQVGYLHGFIEAMELNKDKQFTLVGMQKMFYLGCSLQSDLKSGKLEYKPKGEVFNDYIKSIQQPTEIEVEIEMECLDPNCDGIDKKGVCIPGDKPKLDSEGCLILKKI
jgi:hypothetical protein